MCGVVGFFPSFSKSESSHVLKRMLTRIKHRGPDESGVYISNDIALGSVRLSIIDLKTGTMPLSNKNGRFWIVFNGEIFNYIELRQELIERGHSFNSQSDTEVVIHLYEEYGPEFLNKLNGQFAIAIWDKKKKELFLARDRVGIRPLFYTSVNGSLVFASEIKSFLDFPDVKLEFSPNSLAEHFSFWTTISPKTIFKDVFEVEPGTYLKINSKGKTSFRYWELPLSDKNEFENINIKDAVEEFERIFVDSVKLRLRADVPVAAYLSGGLDSSVTTAFIKKINPEILKTFSIGFSDKDYDESYYQEAASDYFETKHENINCDSDQIARDFKNTVWHAEAPLLRTAPVPMSLLAKNVKDHNIKVVITGEGADELLGGYNIFKEAKIRHFWSKDPNSKYRPLLLKKLYPYLPQMSNANTNMLKMFFGYKLNETSSPIYSHLLRWKNTSRIKNYLSEDYLKLIGDYDPVNLISKKLESKFQNIDNLSKAQFLELNIFMSGYLLSSQGDRMSMTHSIEGRYPFLDHRLIEFCMKLSPDLKLRGLNEKYLLKKVVEGKIPEAILKRPKQAYRAPIRSTFFSENLPIYLEQMMSPLVIRKFGIFNPKLVKQLIYKMKNNQKISEIDNMAFTGVLSIQILNDLFINGSHPKLSDKNLINFDKIVIE